MKKLLFPLPFLFAVFTAVAQDSLSFFSPAPEFKPKRFYAVAGFQAAAYGAAVVGFNELWYDQYERSKFHWFNDNDEWLQVDKVGHVASGYRVSQISTNLLHWSGISERKSSAYGSVVGFITTSTVEVFDGFSANWGASWGDLLGNAIGSGLLFAEYRMNDPYTFNIKMSAHPTSFAQHRPAVLGSSPFERLFKDYNGQTYWLSVGVKHFLPYKNIPDWLNVAVGYGGTGMLGGTVNPDFNEAGISLPNVRRVRQYYFSLDIELRKIDFKSPFLKAVFNNFGFLKIPAPALEFSRQGVHFHPLYF